MSNIFFKIKRIIAKIFIIILTPRYSFLLFQIRYIERFTGIDTFFLSPRRFLIYIIECITLNDLKRIKLHDYGNYKLLKNKIPKNPIVYSGGVGTNISFDLELLRIHGGKVRLFDPTPSSIKYMHKFKNNKKIKFYPTALYHKNERVKIYFDPTNRVKSNSISNFLNFNKKSFYKVNAKNILYFVKKNKDQKIDILKLDIEGVAEDLLIHTLKNNIKPKQIIFALEVPMNYLKFFYFIKKFLLIIKILKKDYNLYNIRNRSRGVESEILAILK